MMSCCLRRGFPWGDKLSILTVLTHSYIRVCYAPGECLHVVSKMGGPFGPCPRRQPLTCDPSLASSGGILAKMCGGATGVKGAPIGTAEPRPAWRTSSVQHCCLTRRTGEHSCTEKLLPCLQQHRGRHQHSSGSSPSSFCLNCAQPSMPILLLLFPPLPRPGASPFVASYPLVWGAHCVAASRPRPLMWHVGEEAPY